MTTETQDLKNGDRVRVVLEGVVQDAQAIGPAGQAFDIVADSNDGAGCSWINCTAGHVKSIEQIKPALPTTPGSVVRFSEDGRFAHLNREGEWVADNGGEYSAAAFRSSSTAWNHEVLFDAGASK